jgi:type I restriction enzyme S subunit
MVPEGWSITKLSDLADVKRGAGSQYLTYVDEADEGIRLIRIGDFLGDNPKFVSHTSDMDRFILKKNDILIAGTGATAGITFEVPEHFEGYAFSYNAPRIRPKKHVDKVFLVNFLKSNEITKQQRSLFTGNAQPFLDTKAIGGFKILTPPLPEQRKIADILSTWDAAIETTEALLATAKAQKRALMQSLLTGKRRFPEFEGQPWKEVRLGDVLDIQYGKSPKEIFVENGSIPIVGTGGITGRTETSMAHGPAIVIGRKGTIDSPQWIDGPFWCIDTTYYCKTSDGTDLRWVFAWLGSINLKVFNEASGVPSLE